MSRFLNSLEAKLRVMEEEMRTLPAELDSLLRRLDRAKLGRLLLRLDQDCNRLLDEQFNAQIRESGTWGSNIVVFPFILFPDDLDSPLYRRITNEDLAKWRAAWKSNIPVVLGKYGVEVIAVSKLVKEYNVTISEIILVAQRQGETVLDWDQYLRLLDEIGSLIGEDEKSLPVVVTGILIMAPGPPQQAKVLPKNSPL